MRPIFTIHAGEYLVANQIEERFTKSHGLRVWIPSKDDGIDLLVTDDACKKSVKLQVKFSKDFDHGVEYRASGWWSLNSKKIAESTADYWVLALPMADRENVYRDCFFIALPPKELLRRLKVVHGEPSKNDVYNLYLTVKDDRVVDTRSLKKKDATKAFMNLKDDRNYSQYLNGLDLIAREFLK